MWFGVIAVAALFSRERERRYTANETANWLNVDFSEFISAWSRISYFGTFQFFFCLLFMFSVCLFADNICLSLTHSFSSRRARTHFVQATHNTIWLSAESSFAVVFNKLSINRFLYVYDFGFSMFISRRICIVFDACVHCMCVCASVRARTRFANVFEYAVND